MFELMPGGPVIDVTAILIAVSGGRRIELNKSERLLAASMILAGGGRQSDVVARLGISKAEVSRMHARICNLVNPAAVAS